MIEALDLEYNFLDLKTQGYEFNFEPTVPSWTSTMPNPVCNIAQGHPTFTINMMVWSDDILGNRSKQYNAHTNVYLANLNLPHRKLQQEYFIQFCSTSPHASSSEQMKAVMQDMSVQNPFII